MPPQIAATHFKNLLDRLKKIAPMFPNIYIEEAMDEIHATTKVIIHSEGVFGIRHILQSYALSGTENKKEITDTLSERVDWSAKLSIVEAIPTKYDEPVTITVNPNHEI